MNNDTPADAIIDSIVQDICELDNNPFDGMADDDVWLSSADLRVILERNFEGHRTTSIAAQADRDAAPENSCDLGVGCDEAGVCYAKANGKPEMCPRTTSLAAQDGLVDALAYMLRVFDETNANDYDDVHLMVKQGAKITSIANCRAALASIEVKS